MPKPTLDLYLDKRVTAITRGNMPHEWGIKLQGDVEIRNKDQRETVAPIGLVGMRFSSMSMSEFDTTMHFSGEDMKIEKFSFNPTRHAIFDPKYGTEVIPQWPEELEAVGNVPEGTEPSGEPVSEQEWEKHRAGLRHERDARVRSEAQEFHSEEEE